MPPAAQWQYPNNGACPQVSSMLLVYCCMPHSSSKVHALQLILSACHQAQVLYNAMLENNCSEHASRMSAMENSSKSAGEILGRLTLTYNRSVQKGLDGKEVRARWCWGDLRQAHTHNWLPQGSHFRQGMQMWERHFMGGTRVLGRHWAGSH